METVKAGVLKRKKMTAHAWKSRFKRLRAPEVETELEGSDKPSHVCNNNSITVVPKPAAKTTHVDDLSVSGVVGILRNKTIATISDGPLETGSLNGCGLTAMENDSNIDSNLKDNVVVESPGKGGLENLRVDSNSSREILDDCERLPASGSLLKNKNSSGPESITCLGGLQDGFLNSEHHENETLPGKSVNCGLVETHMTCSKEKRMNCSAHEKELSSCVATTDVEMDGSSSRKKLASKGESAEDEISYEIMKIQRLCDKRMKKLKRKQQRDLQDWEEEKLRLEHHHKLETAFISFLFGEGSTRAGKLKLLEGYFKKRMEELNTQLKDIELQHQSAMSVERCKAAQWLAAAKAFCSSEQKAAAVCGVQTLVSRSKEDGEAMDTEVTTQHMAVNDSNKAMSMQGNEVDPFDQTREDGGCSPANEPKEDGECSQRQHLVEGMDTNITTQCMVINDSNKAVSMQGNEEPFDQINRWETVCSNLPASEERGCDKMQPIESNMGVPLDVPKIVANVDPVEFSNSPNNQEANVIADCLANQGGDSAEPRPSDSPLAGLVSEPSEQRETVPNHSSSLTLQVSEDQAHRNLVSANPQENSASALDGQSTLQIEVANFELDSIGTDVQPHIEEQRIENSEQQCLVPPIHASPSCDLFPATKVDCQNRDSSSLTAGAVETLVLPPESLVCANPQDGNLPVPEGPDTLQIEVTNLELENTRHHVQSHIENHEQQHLVSTDASSSCNPSPAAHAEPQIHDSGRNTSHAAEAEEPVVLPLESSSQIVGNISSWLKNPLEYQLVRLHKEHEQFEQSSKDMNLHLKTVCEKEIQEMIAQIQSKYDKKLKDVETEFKLKKNELQKNRDKVLLNRMLADVLNIHRVRCSSDFPGMQQGILPSHMQHHRQPSIQQFVLQPSNVQVPSPTQGLMQQLWVPHPTTHIAAERHAEHLSYGSSSRPPMNSARNPYMMEGYRSPAPHLQSFGQPLPLEPFQSLQSPPVRQQHNPQPMLPPYQNQATFPYGLTGFLCQSQATQSFVAGINPQQPMPGYGTTQNLPEVSSSFGSLDPSFWQSMNNVNVSNPPYAASSSDVICLVDDDDD